MKKLFTLAFAALLTGSLFANTPDAIVNEKVLKVFLSTFSGAEDVNWTEEENIYSVKFTHQGVRSTVKYDEDGNFLSSLRYYDPSQLPVDVLCKLKKKFPEKTAFGVTEYTIGDEVNFYVKMEDAKNWITVKVDNYRAYVVTEKFKKA
ncbi:MAG: hypothetical protein H7Y27_03170 [Gemmatimonadaceae bacterium]|nr:hypothetical protein [Chitinophagaceae bacterium]